MSVGSCPRADVECPIGIDDVARVRRADANEVRLIDIDRAFNIYAHLA